MAVTGHSVILGAPLIVLALPFLRADQPSQIRSQLEVVARGLSAGDPAAAISPFDKSYADYDKLSNYFGGLTNAFQIVNEIDVVDEQDTEAEIKATVHWTITLSDLGSNYTERRVGDIQVQLVLKDHKWKIVEFSPIEVFDPQLKRPPG
jgi:hypothetical protein